VRRTSLHMAYQFANDRREGPAREAVLFMRWTTLGKALKMSIYSEITPRNPYDLRLFPSNQAVDCTLAP